MRKLLDELQMLFPQFGTDHADHMGTIGQRYAQVIHEEQISEAMFNRGCTRLAGQRWYPNPAQFAGLCKGTPEELGLPDAAKAYQEACDRSHEPRPQAFSHPAVYLAARATGWFELKHRGGEQEIRRLFRRNYDLYAGQVINGDNLQEQLPKAIEYTSPVDQQGRIERTGKQLKTGNAALKRIREMLL